MAFEMAPIASSIDSDAKLALLAMAAATFEFTSAMMEAIFRRCAVSSMRWTSPSFFSVCAADSFLARASVFSILNDTFDDDQERALADYIELSLQLQYNERSRTPS